MKCSLCNSSLNHKVSPDFYKCGKCNAYIKELSTFLDSAKEQERYLTHNNDVYDPRYRKFTSPISQRILSNFQPHHLGLDFGCGTGPVIAKVLQEKNYQILLYDPFFQPINENLEKKYDYIACCEVAEHFHDPQEEFLRLNQLLKLDGKLYIMTQMFENQDQNFSDWYYIQDPTHVVIYTFKSFEFIAENFGFQVEFEGTRLIVLKKIRDFSKQLKIC